MMTDFDRAEHELRFLRSKVEAFETLVSRAAAKFQRDRAHWSLTGDAFGGASAAELRKAAAGAFDLESVAFGIIFSEIVPHLKSRAALGEFECEYCYFHVAPLKDDVAHAAMAHVIEMLKREPLGLDVTHHPQAASILVRW